MITRPEESYRLWRVVVCDLETSRMGTPYIYDISRLRVKCNFIFVNMPHHIRNCTNTLYNYAIIINIYVSLMYKLKKNGKVFTSKFVGTGPSYYEIRIYWAAVSHRLRNTALKPLRI